MKIIFLILLSLSGLWVLFMIARWIRGITRDVKHTTATKEHTEIKRKAVDSAVEEYLQDKQESETLNNDFKKGESK
ncbi:MAG: hypothetical protein ACYS0I_08530 [Planctomycetota bacterium]